MPRLSKIKEKSLPKTLKALKTLLRISVKSCSSLCNRNNDIIHEINDEINEIILSLQQFNIDTVYAKIDNYNLFCIKDYFTIFAGLLNLIIKIIKENYIYISSFKECLTEPLIPFFYIFCIKSFLEVNELLEFRENITQRNKKDNEMKLDNYSDRLVNKNLSKIFRFEGFFEKIMKKEKKQLAIKNQNLEEYDPIQTDYLESNCNINRNSNKSIRQNLSSQNYGQRNSSIFKSSITNFKEQLINNSRFNKNTIHSSNYSPSNVFYIFDNNSQKQDNVVIRYIGTRTNLPLEIEDYQKQDYPFNKDNLNEKIYETNGFSDYSPIPIMGEQNFKQSESIKLKEIIKLKEQKEIKMIKKGINYKINNIFLFRNNKLITIYLLLVIILRQSLPILCGPKSNQNSQSSSKIILKVIGSGKKYILANTHYFPFFSIVNKVKQS